MSAAAPMTLPAEDEILVGRPTDAELQDQLINTAWGGPAPSKKHWMMAFGIAAAFTGLLFLCIGYTITTGIGVWGNNIPVGWAFDIINFVWWVGIAHAGTFISAILLLTEQKWRTSINRFAEAMTLFAVAQAGIFPLLHLGRPWFAYWLFPYPSRLGVWPQLKSALPWDAAAISTYATVSVLFWYLGLIPDLAAARDRAPKMWARRLYGILCLGWRGSATDWNHWRIAYGLLGGIAAPLVLSVHSVVSMDFASANVPGWHATIFPPYFVAGAIFSGFAMVITLVIPARRYFRLENVITMKHLDNMAKVILVTGWIVAYSYSTEWFTAWYSADPTEFYSLLVARALDGPRWWVFWIMVFCNIVTPQIFWSKRARNSIVVLWIASILVNIGMWTERFVIIVTSLQRDYIPASWHEYLPTWVDVGIFVGTLGFFSLLCLAFLKFAPFIPIAELKEMKAELIKEEAHRHGAAQ